jgi:hypothetical protein
VLHAQFAACVPVQNDVVALPDEQRVPAALGLDALLQRQEFALSLRGDERLEGGLDLQRLRVRSVPVVLARDAGRFIGLLSFVCRIHGGDLASARFRAGYARWPARLLSPADDIAAYLRSNYRFGNGALAQQSTRLRRCRSYCPAVQWWLWNPRMGAE